MRTVEMDEIDTIFDRARISIIWGDMERARELQREAYKAMIKAGIQVEPPPFDN